MQSADGLRPLRAPCSHLMRHFALSVTNLLMARLVPTWHLASSSVRPWAWLAVTRPAARTRVAAAEHTPPTRLLRSSPPCIVGFLSARPEGPTDAQPRAGMPARHRRRLHFTYPDGDAVKAHFSGDDVPVTTSSARFGGGRAHRRDGGWLGGTKGRMAA